MDVARREDQEGTRLSIISVLFPSTIIISPVGAFLGKRPWMSSDRYSLKVNPDKLAHSLYLPGLLDRFFHVRPRVLSKASAAVIGKIVLVITITSSRFDGCSHAKLHRKQMTSFLYVYRETYLEFPLIKITERMVTRWFLYFQV